MKDAEGLPPALAVVATPSSRWPRSWLSRFPVIPNPSPAIEIILADQVTLLR
ncbi:MAG: hypothetical protein ACRDJW_12420 [Thermomicrobiales bacterium]